MIADWLAREGWIVFSWWALVTLAGAAVLPLCLRLLGGLPDRGYTLARAAGMLLVAFVFWFVGSLGFLRNTPGGLILAWIIVLAISLVVYGRGGRINLRDWWGENRALIVTAEVLFVVLLVGWSVVRAHQNGLVATEKPMDLAMMSAIQRSESFPPNDPWLSGYAISYYYFGYLMSAGLSMMSGIASTTGFNMTISLVFALTGLTAFGVVYNLVRSRAVSRVGEVRRKYAPRNQAAALVFGVVGMVFVVLLGNFQAALIEWPYETRTASEDWLRFWATQDRIVYPERQQAIEAGIPASEPVTLQTGREDPAVWEFWWWFRASRVLTDFNLDGTVAGWAQPIDEFPQFSFLLADNHPHVMALPFVVLAIGLALNLLLKKTDPNAGEIVFYGLCIGALVFLNTWDWPIYMVILVGSDALRRLIRNSGRLYTGDWFGLAALGIAQTVLMLFFYFPFLISFSSQASGIVPNWTNPTLFRHYFIMFGPFLLILPFFVGVEAWRGRANLNLSLGIRIAGAVLVACIAVLLLLTLVGFLVPELRGVLLRFIDENGGGDVTGLVLARRAAHILTTLVLLAGIVLIVARLFPGRRRSRRGEAAEYGVDSIEPGGIVYPPAAGFALLLVGAALVLSLVPEFFFLRDNFAVRINTIFKFYYQVWVLFAIASAYGLYSLLVDTRAEKLVLPLKVLAGGVAAVGVAMGLVYPVLGIHNRMFVETGRLRAENPASLTLDGGRGFATASDYESIMCLKDTVSGSTGIAVAEAVGPAYRNEFGRVAALSGLPIVLGWENHQSQWRGPTYGQVVGTRPQDIAMLYTTPRWDIAEPIIRQYGIDYIFYGSSERITYGSGGEEKFIEVLEPLCHSGDSVFYRVTDAVLALAANTP